MHEKYSDMTSYDGTETADIIYDDVGGELTSYLARCEYIDEDIWRGKTPKYLLEVKTTTQECDTRFFMSKSQVQRVSHRSICSSLATMATRRQRPCADILLTDFGIDGTNGHPAR